MDRRAAGTWSIHRQSRGSVTIGQEYTPSEWGVCQSSPGWRPRHLKQFLALAEQVLDRDALGTSQLYRVTPQGSTDALRRGFAGKLFGGCPDLLICCVNEWIKFWDFRGVVTLLVFPKQKEIRFILRAVSMKEELVLAHDLSL